MALTEPPEAANDFVGYEVLIDFIEERALCELPGDLIEIGAFMGGGTAKLARFALISLGVWFIVWLIMIIVAVSLGTSYMPW